jgi:23S rRNA pseudouridine1911/1915/1917 synthase
MTTADQTNIRHMVVGEENSGDRLDVFVSEELNISRSRAQKLIEDGFVSFNNVVLTKVSKSVKTGDEAVVVLPEPEPIELVAQDIPLDIVYEDEYLAVINKQQGLTVHPAGGSYTNTLVNALLFKIKNLSGINGDIRPGIVHRLDKDTSGLMVVAKNDLAHVDLSGQIERKECRRIYYALLEGVVKSDSGTINQPIGRSKTDRKKMAVDAKGKSAVTMYEAVKRYADFTLMKFELKTGRTHQIRVHASFLGHPVVGDKAYGFKKQKFVLNGQLLHSKIIEFTHPVTKEHMRFESQLPDYFLKVLSTLS